MSKQLRPARFKWWGIIQSGCFGFMWLHTFTKKEISEVDMGIFSMIFRCLVVVMTIFFLAQMDAGVMACGDLGELCYMAQESCCEGYQCSPIGNGAGFCVASD
ncbi:uncharacterized protein LOC144157691 [Haemaphysalis longicornis]